jgi:hypothetical protein
MIISKLIKNKKISIPLLIVLICGASTIVYFFFIRQNINGVGNGTAAFYKYPSEKIDSILENKKPVEKVEYLFMTGNLNDNNFAENKSKHSGGFYYNLDKDTNTNLIINISPTAFYINAINEEILKYYSTDSSDNNESINSDSFISFENDIVSVTPNSPFVRKMPSESRFFIN